MASNAKRKTTMAKLNREAKLREKRAEKAARKDARKHAAANPPAEPLELDDAATPPTTPPCQITNSPRVNCGNTEVPGIGGQKAPPCRTHQHRVFDHRLSRR